MTINFVLLWWHIPLVMVILGIAMSMIGTESRLSAFGWPDTEFTAVGWIGILSGLIGIILLIGGFYRGLFI